jgi:hypothetical protein
MITSGSSRLLMSAFVLSVTATLAVPFGPVNAKGTVVVQQHDGSTKKYNNVRIQVRNDEMAITSADGKGTIVLGKSACNKVGELIECLPYDATLFQNGERTHIALQSGTVWLNPGTTAQQVSNSSTTLPPRGVLLSVKTKKGTNVSLTGVVDEVQK